MEVMPVIALMCELLKPTSCVRNLDIMMDQNLTWQQHLKLVSHRCFGTLVGLAHTEHVFHYHVMPRLFDALVILHVQYCIQVYGS